MLTIAKQTLLPNIQKMLYDAYMTQFQENTVPQAAKYDVEMQQAFMKNADKFSKAAAGPTTEAIYNFVKEIGININISGTIIAPPMPPALPGGPCSGQIPLSNVTVL